MPISLAQILDEGCARLRVKLTSKQHSGVYKYLKLLHKWNQRINLSGTRSERSLLELHILDALAIVPHIPARATQLVDVGSGAGFAAVASAIARPDLAVTALEPAHKKHAFLSTVKRELPLANLTPLAVRIEDHLADSSFAPFDVAVSRATWPLLDWLERGSRLVRKGGTVLGMEGATKHALPREASRHEYALTDRTRAIIVYRR